MTDAELLRSFASTRSQAHFEELVSRHAGLVYSAALRQLRGDSHRAQEVTQMVFIALARKAVRLAGHPALPAWLHRSTRLAAAELIRRESRRTAYEAAAARDNDRVVEEEATDWSQVRPILDETIDQLGNADRAAILLRYFSALSYSEIGRRLRLSENASRMRVDRALEKLRAQLQRRGITSTSALLAGWLATQAVGAAPAPVLTSAVAIATGSLGWMGTVAGSVSFATFMTTNKLALATLGVALVGASALVTAEQRQTGSLAGQISALNQQWAADNAAMGDHARLVAAQHRQEVEEQELAALPHQIASIRQASALLQAQLAAVARSRISKQTPDGRADVYDVSKLDLMPRPTFQGPPVYPAALRAAGVSGQAVVDFIVDSEGAVRGAYAVHSSNPGFEQPAVDAVSTWTFAAGRKQGIPVNTHLQVPVVFSLNPQNSGPPSMQVLEGPQDWFPVHS